MNLKKNRILFVSREFPPEQIGGIGSYVANMVDALDLRGFRVTLVTETQIGKPNELGGKIKIYRLPTKGNWEWYLRLTIWLLQHHKEFDFIEDQLYGGSIFFARFLLGKKIKYHVYAHGNLAKTYLFDNITGWRKAIKLPIMNSMEKYVFLHAIYRICPSNSYAEMLSMQWQYPLAQIKISGFPVSKEQLKAGSAANLPGELKLLMGEYFLYYGRLQYLKGVLDLMKVIPSLLREFSECSFVFAGRDVMNFRGIFKKYLSGHGYEDILKRVIFLEPIRDKETMMTTVAKAKVVFVPSIYESYSNAVLESIFLRKKLCCTFAGGIKDILLATRSDNYFRFRADTSNEYVHDMFRWIRGPNSGSGQLTIGEYNEKSLLFYVSQLKEYER